jgi:signal transduction histidine kinase
MNAARTRSAAFFIQYLLLLVASLVWVQFGTVRSRVNDIGQFYALIAGSLCYLGVRSYLVLRRRVSTKWSSLWVSLDLAIISCAVYLTGGINSEAALVYFWPMVTSSIQRFPRRTVAVSIATGLLYVLATWSTRQDPKYAAALSFRLIVLALVAFLATYYALAEQALVDEVVKLREAAALADYRGRLSREMHDGIQHYLANIAVRLELARKLADTDPAEAARVAVDQRFAIRQAAAELRYLVRLLRSPALEREGFVDAVRHHLSLFTEGSSMSVPLEVHGDVRPLPPDLAQAAFRVMQEALMNAEKHAHATEVRVTLSFDADRFGCVIKDDGVGFDPASLSQAPLAGGGFGLPSMAQRAESVGGKISVSSAPGEGTVVEFTAPICETGMTGKGP